MPEHLHSSLDVFCFYRLRLEQQLLQQQQQQQKPLRHTIYIGVLGGQRQILVVLKIKSMQFWRHGKVNWCLPVRNLLI